MEELTKGRWILYKNAHNSWCYVKLFCTCPPILSLPWHPLTSARSLLVALGLLWISIDLPPPPTLSRLQPSTFSVSPLLWFTKSSSKIERIMHQTATANNTQFAFVIYRHHIDSHCHCYYAIAGFFITTRQRYIDMLSALHQIISTTN